MGSYTESAPNRCARRSRDEDQSAKPAGWYQAPGTVRPVPAQASIPLNTAQNTITAISPSSYRIMT